MRVIRTVNRATLASRVMDGRLTGRLAEATGWLIVPVIPVARRFQLPAVATGVPELIKRSVRFHRLFPCCVRQDENKKATTAR